MAENIEDLIVALVGWIGDESLPEGAIWPEPWPPRPDAPEWVGDLTRELGLTKRQYEGACELAQELVADPDFQEAVDLVARALMVAPQIDHEGLEVLREADVILPHAFDKTIAAWQASRKWVPLLFEHSHRSVGEIDPDSMQATNEGLVVRGHVDQVTDEGEQVWRQIKSNTASFSIGGIFESRPRDGKSQGREIYEIDLLEISATSTPAHGATRVLDWKSERRYELPDGRVVGYDEMVAYATARSRAEKAARPI